MTKVESNYNALNVDIGLDKCSITDRVIVEMLLALVNLGMGILTEIINPYT